MVPYGAPYPKTMILEPVPPFSKYEFLMVPYAASVLNTTNPVPEPTPCIFATAFILSTVTYGASMNKSAFKKLMPVMLVLFAPLTTLNMIHFLLVVLLSNNASLVEEITFTGLLMYKV